MIFTTQLPCESADIGGDDVEIMSIVDRILKSDYEGRHSAFVANPGVYALKDALATTIADADVRFEGTGRPFNYIHKVVDDKNVWYFANPGIDSSKHAIFLRSPVKRAVLMNPKTGNVKEAEFIRESDRCIRLDLMLESGESVFFLGK